MVDQVKKSKHDPKTKETGCFVVQKHDASHLHYDFRLEIDGVLASWAIPKGPSMNPSDKRLAIKVEDHPLAYGSFEGTIPKGNYGAGTVMVWDKGLYACVDDENQMSLKDGLAKGRISFILEGQKLKGRFSLIYLKEKQWLLIKKEDDFATLEDVTRLDRSVISKKKIEEID